MSNDTSRIEIITGRERRRRYSAEHKLQLVEETMQPGMTVSAVARLHGVSPSLLFKSRQLMSEGGRTDVRADEDVVVSRRVRELEARVRDLERVTLAGDAELRPPKSFAGGLERRKNS